MAKHVLRSYVLPVLLAPTMGIATSDNGTLQLLRPRLLHFVATFDIRARQDAKRTNRSRVPGTIPSCPKSPKMQPPKALKLMSGS